MVINDVGIQYNHPDLQPKAWINSPEDINQNGRFDSGDLNGYDNDGNGFIDDVIGGSFGDYIVYGDTCMKCYGPPDTCPPQGCLPSPPQPTCDAINPAGRPLIRVCKADCPWLPANCTLAVYADSIVPAGFSAAGISGGGIHGTRVAGIAVAAADTAGVAGAAPNCRFLAVTSSSGKISGNVTGLLYARRMAKLKNKKMVINMSWQVEGEPLPEEERNKGVLKLVLDSLAKDSIIMVVSAGNDDADKANYPASDPKVISVSGLDTNNVRPALPDEEYAPTYNASVALSAPWEHWVAFASGVVYSWKYTYYSELTPDQTCVIPDDGTGTSFAAPLVAGAAALVKSVYPKFDNAEIKAKLRSSTDPMRFLATQDSLTWGTKMGTGRLNAFKALTFYGNIPNAANDTSLSDTVYVSGDITVRNGKTLRLAAGTVLRLYPGDVLKKGVDINKTEIIVEAGGKLIIEGTSNNPVKLVSFRNEQAPYDSTTNYDWRGIVVRPGAVFACSNAIIRHAYAGIEDSSRYLHTIQNVRIGKCKMYGILVESTDSLTIRGCGIDSVNASPGGYGIYIHASSAGRWPVLKRDTVRNCYYGIKLVNAGSPVDSCVILGTSIAGIVCNGQALLNPPAEVPITNTAITGYFNYEHLQNDWKGRSRLTNCNLASATSPSRTAVGIRSTGTDAYLRVRKSQITEWNTFGVIIEQNGTPFTNLGDSASSDSVNYIYTGSTYSTRKYVDDQDCGSCSTPVIKAEYNCWGEVNPPASRFSNNIDRSPVDYSCMVDPKLAVEEKKEEGNLPRRTTLYQNYPNPFNPTTLIQFELEKPEKVNLAIYNILGQRVRTMLAGEQFAAGPYTFLWDGKDDRGSPVSSGTYIYKLQTQSFSQTKKMSLVK